MTTPKDSSERDTLTKMRANNFQFSIGDCEILRLVNKKQAQKCDIFFSKKWTCQIKIDSELAHFAPFLKNGIYQLISG